MSGAAVAGVGVLTGWGQGTGALPADARREAGARPIIPIARPSSGGDRFRRATRECLLGVAALEALLREQGLGRDDIRGESTALVYVTAAAYGASNQAWVGGAGGALHFPYTAPSAVPAEVAIEFGLAGRSVIVLGGGAAAVDALWQAGALVGSGACSRALVLAVETVEECAALYARGRWLLRRPLVEAAACALVVPGATPLRYVSATADTELERLARVRAGETLACAPLIALALAVERGAGAARVTAEWRGRRAAIACDVARR
jgi:hypothetical protein